MRNLLPFKRALLTQGLELVFSYPQQRFPRKHMHKHIGLTMINIKPDKLHDCTKSQISVILPEGNSFSFDKHIHGGTFINIYHLLTDKNSVTPMRH